MKLIQNWRRALLMFSVQANTVNVAGLTAWATLGDLRERIPENYVLGFSIAMLVLGTIGRLIDQPTTRN